MKMRLRVKKITKKIYAFEQKTWEMEHLWLEWQHKVDELNTSYTNEKLSERRQEIKKIGFIKNKLNLEKAKKKKNTAQKQSPL